MFLHPESTDPRMVIKDLEALERILVNEFNSDIVGQKTLNKEHTVAIANINNLLEKCQHDFSSIENNILSIHKLLIAIEKDKELSKELLVKLATLVKIFKETNFSNSLFNARGQYNKEFFDPIINNIEEIKKHLAEIYGYEEQIQVKTSDIN